MRLFTVAMRLVRIFYVSPYDFSVRLVTAAVRLILCFLCETIVTAAVRLVLVIYL